MAETGNAGDPERRPLLEWLLRRYADTPRTRAKQWIASGRVSVGGVVLRRPQEMMPDPGAQLQLVGRTASGLDLGDGVQVHPRVKLLYLDGSVAVVDKGPGVLSVPGNPGVLSALGILQDFLDGHLRVRSFTQKLPPAFRKIQLGPVHRLDQFTTGVFCMASSPAARAVLIEQASRHTMGREYVAFCQGRPAADTGTWRDWLELSADEMHQRVVSGPRQPGQVTAAVEAVTHYELSKVYTFKDGKTVVSRLRLRLETGRKHQIRAQAAHAGLPLIGDRTYNMDYARGALPVIPFERQALHAEKLTLTHPATGARQTWRAELAPDMKQLESRLRALA